MIVGDVAAWDRVPPDGAERQELEAWAEVEVLRRSAAAAAAEAFALTEHLWGGPRGPAGAADESSELRVALNRARRLLQRAEEAMEGRRRDLAAPDHVRERLQALTDLATELDEEYDSAIADARSALEVYLQAVAIVFRTPHRIAAARAEFWAVATLFGVDVPDDWQGPPASVSPELRHELLQPPLGEAGRAGEALGAAAHRLRHAAAVLADVRGPEKRSSPEERAHALSVVRCHVGPTFRPIVEVLEARIRASAPPASPSLD